MGRLLISLALASVLVLEMGSPGRGQWSSSSSSQSSMFGSRSVGSGSSRFTSAGLSQSASSGSRSGTTGRSSSQQSFGAQAPASTRQVGNFVGADRQDVEALFGATNAAGRNGGTGNTGRTTRSSNGRGTNQANRGNNGAGQGGGAATELRTSLRVGFESPHPAPSRVATILTDRLARSTRIRVVGPVTVDVQQDTTILRGEVATPHDRILAEQLALLEPGVRRVKNELVVTGESTTPATTDQPTAEESKTPPATPPPAPGA
jgi:osmotically-inducible protein OsmY